MTRNDLPRKRISCVFRACFIVVGVSLLLGVNRVSADASRSEDERVEGEKVEREKVKREKVEREKIDLRNVSYSEVGLTTGAAYVNFNLGFWHKRTGLRVSGGYLGKDQNELMLNLGYKVSDNATRLHSVNLVVGKIVASDPGADYNFSYVGVAYGLNYRGFFVELGIAKDFDDKIGNLEDDPFIPVGTVGYVHRFIPLK